MKMNFLIKATLLSLCFKTSTTIGISSVTNAIQSTAGAAVGKSSNLATNIVQSLPAIPGLGAIQKKCYEDLGCFSNHDDFNLFNNPIALLPMSPQEIDVTFYLFTCANRYKAIVFNYRTDNKSITDSPFDGSKKTKFIIHGFSASYDDMGWTGDMKDFILSDSCDYNVIGVDWSNGAKGPNYPQAVANTRVVGAIIAHFINRLITLENTSADKISLIGHSLGAHTSGFAGARIRSPKLAQITGLDPAGPAFQADDPSKRLDQTDASLVVNIHTDAGDIIAEGFGIYDQLGHYDIYPNNGAQQPGCEPTRGVSNVLVNGISTGLSETITCNHGRAQLLAVADPSLYGTCQLIAYECESYDEFIDGRCADCGVDGEKCKPLPLNLEFWDNSDNYNVQETQPPKKLYITTTSMTPFCLFHYQVVVFTSKDSSVTSGKITISLFGEKRNVFSVQLTKVFSKFQSGDKYTYLLTYPKDLGVVSNAEVFWNFGGIDVLNPVNILFKPDIIIERVFVNYMSDSDNTVRQQLSSKLCSLSNQIIKSGGSSRFAIC